MSVLKTHHFEKVPGQLTHQLTRVTPYVRLTSEGQVVYLKLGKVVYEDGTLVTKMPAWFEAEFAKLSPQALAECGFGAKQEAAAPRRRTREELVAELEQLDREEAARTHKGNGADHTEPPIGAPNAGQPAPSEPKKKNPALMNKAELVAAIKEKWHFEAPGDFTNAQLRELLEKGPEGD